MGIEMQKAGLLTTIQDLGRVGYQKYGVIVSGAMDDFAHRIANILVGNEEGEAALEVTCIGPEILFHQNALVSICGGNLSPSINGQEAPMWRPIFVRKNSLLHFGKNQSGMRAYLAFGGSFHLEKTMGSASTSIKARLGGFQGRSLKKGDQLQLCQPSERALNYMRNLSSKNLNKSFVWENWFVSNHFLPQYSQSPVIRILKGEQFECFDSESQSNFLKNSFGITAQSDRMGYRLKLEEGTTLRMKQPREMLSEAVALGTIQVPPDGNPILLLADRQTTGGYPKIGQVITVDIPCIAQLKPGDRLSFVEVTLEEAQRKLLKREKKFQNLKEVVVRRMEGEYKDEGGFKL